ncbi:PAPA-1-like conserved region-domain-containing protein [Mycena crocata]|nr:PAPA-1-like conserved region-domain-containing protein [Mycena crocata]
MPIASEESEVDIEVEQMDEEDTSEEEEVEGREEDDEAGEDELEDSDNEQGNGSQSTGTGQVASLKIKLKFGGAAEGKVPVPSRRHARARNEDIESEDSDSDDSQFESYGAGPSTGRQLTARQAALVNAVDPSHVALGSTTGNGSSRKAQYTPSEVALRKEENARKRKNMIEKKLEDEKAETIHRLLKKQSRPKNKRTQVQSDNEDIDMDEDDATVSPGVPALPMFRWVSTSRRPGADVKPVVSVDEDGKPTVVADAGPVASMSFSVPEAFLHPPKIVLEMSTVAPIITPASASAEQAHCAVAGCGGARKYRAVGKPWGVGACGLGHLKVLEGRA